MKSQVQIGLLALRYAFSLSGALKLKNVKRPNGMSMLNNYSADKGKAIGGANLLDLYDRLTLITRNTQEVVTQEELKKLLEVNDSPRAYWGFECSG